MKKNFSRSTIRHGRLFSSQILGAHFNRGNLVVFIVNNIKLRISRSILLNSKSTFQIVLYSQVCQKNYVIIQFFD